MRGMRVLVDSCASNAKMREERFNLAILSLDLVLTVAISVVILISTVPSPVKFLVVGFGAASILLLARYLKGRTSTIMDGISILCGQCESVDVDMLKWIYYCEGGGAGYCYSEPLNKLFAFKACSIRGEETIRRFTPLNFSCVRFSSGSLTEGEGYSIFQGEFYYVDPNGRRKLFHAVGTVLTLNPATLDSVDPESLRMILNTSCG